MSDNLINESGKLECTVNKLNIREEANTNSAIIGSIVKGEIVRYNGYVNDGTNVEGVSKWFNGINGGFMWGGGVKVISVDRPELTAAVGNGCDNLKADVESVQKLLKEKGLKLSVDGIFGNETLSAIKDFQKEALKFKNPDGRVDVGGRTWRALNDPSVKYEPSEKEDFNTKYKDVIFQGSVFPDAPIVTNKKINFNSSIKQKYLPAMEVALQGESNGLKLLCTVMAWHEGYYPGSRSYRTNNPGNIGNTDAGTNVEINSLEDGIKRQRDYIKRIIAGKNQAYPMGETKLIKPFYSKEIANNPQYGLPAWLPGYKFVFTGQLDQFVKIYSTGARAGNSYLSAILSYLIANGLQVTAQSTLNEIVNG